MWCQSVVQNNSRWTRPASLRRVVNFKLEFKRKMKTDIANEQRATLAAVRVRKLQDIRTRKIVHRTFSPKTVAKFHKKYYILCIGVAGYGALGHVPPRLPTIYFFQFTLELHKVRQQLCAVASPNIFVFCDSNCGSSVAAT